MADVHEDRPQQSTKRWQMEVQWRLLRVEATRQPGTKPMTTSDQRQTSVRDGTPEKTHTTQNKSYPTVLYVKFIILQKHQLSDGVTACSDQLPQMTKVPQVPATEKNINREPTRSDENSRLDGKVKIRHLAIPSQLETARRFSMSRCHRCQDQTI